MEQIEIKKITEINENNLNKITEWMYEWWEKDELHRFEKEIRSFFKIDFSNTFLLNEPK